MRLCTQELNNKVGYRGVFRGGGRGKGGVALLLILFRNAPSLELEENEEGKDKNMVK